MSQRSSEWSLSMNMSKKLSRQSPQHWRGITRQQGAVLVVSLLIMSVMSILGINSVKKNIVQERMANNYRAGIESLHNAETGIKDALTQINDEGWHEDGYTNDLDLNGDGNNSDARTWIGADPTTGVYYNLVIVNNDGDPDPAVDTDDIVMLKVQGIGSNGTVRTIEVAIGVTSGVATMWEKAILTNEDLKISGNPNLKGTLVDIHSNGDVDLDGTTNTKGVVSASGKVSGSPGGGGSKLSGAANIAIPDIQPSDFEQYVDYVLKSNGKIYRGDGSYYGNADGNEVGGFKFGGDKWTVEKSKASDILNGDLYFKGQYGNLVIGNSPGSNGNKWNVTIMTDGYLEISGNPYFSNYKDPNDPEGFQNILFLTGTDLKINGNYNSDQKLQGLLYAREQIDISGNPNIHGAIIAAGLSNSDDMAKDGNSISGNPNITYDGLVTPWDAPAAGDAIILSWQQLTLAEGAEDFAGFEKVEWQNYSGYQ